MLGVLEGKAKERSLVVSTDTTDSWSKCSSSSESVNISGGSLERGISLSIHEELVSAILCHPELGSAILSAGGQL